MRTSFASAISVLGVVAAGAAAFAVNTAVLSPSGEAIATASAPIAAPSATIAPVADPPQVATRVKVTIAWLDEAPLSAPARLEVRQSARLVPAIVEELHERLDLDAMKHEQADALEANDLGIATLLLAQPLVVQPYAANREMGSMVLVDPGSNRTVGAVMVREVIAD